MSATPNPEEWATRLKKYAAATGTRKLPGNTGASEHQLVAAEERLKIKLPPSYRAFLSASNGWTFASDMTPAIRPIEKVRWFRKEHKDWYEAYQMTAEPICVLEKDYFDYAKQDCAVFEIKHLAQTLCISEIGDDAVVLLNPMVVWPDGEWETWFFSNSSPGATRYRSFADWMAYELDQPIERTPVPGELPTVYRDPPGKENRRIRPRQKVPVLEDVLKKLKSEKEDVRVKAADQLAWLGGKQAVAALIAALNDPVPRVQWAAADSLGVLGAPEALEPLITVASECLQEADPDEISALEKSHDPGAQVLLTLVKRGGFGANSNAVAALAAYDDERSAQILLKILENGGYCASTAGGALAKRGDARGIKSFVNFLTATTSNDSAIQHIGDIAGRLVVSFGAAGYAALEPLMSDPDVKVRGRAGCGISDIAFGATDKNLRRKAFELLQRCYATETDAGLREALEIDIKISAKKNLR